VSTNATESYSNPVVPTSTVKSNLLLSGAKSVPSRNIGGDSAPLAMVQEVEITGVAASAEGITTMDVAKRKRVLNFEKTASNELFVLYISLQCIFIISTPVRDHFHDRGL